MTWIKATDIAYGRLRAPDLDVMEEFLTRFGMVRAERTNTALYMRGSDPAHHIHVTEKGDPKFVGFAYYAASEDDLKRVARAPGASAIEAIDEPGGGKRVRLTEPNGYQIEVVHGIATLAPIATKRQKLNTGEDPLLRAGELMRLPKGPSHVKRIGHGVLMTPKFRETVDWFREMLGFIRSEEHTSELQSRRDLVCRLLLEKKKKTKRKLHDTPTTKKKRKHTQPDTTV